MAQHGPVDPRLLAARRLPGSINLCIGPGNCGKTDFAMRMSLMSACLHGIDWYGYDSGGDAVKHFDSIVYYYRIVIEQARRAVRLRARPIRTDDEVDARRAYATFVQPTGMNSFASIERELLRVWLDPTGENPQALPKRWEELKPKERAVWLDPVGQDATARRRLQFIASRRHSIYDGPKTLPSLIRQMTKWIDESRELAREKRGLVAPRCVVFIDEAGAVRAEDELFWENMRQARNAGVTLWTAGHRLTDLRPAALAVARCKVLWKPTDRSYVEVAKGTRIRRELLTDHQSDLIRYVVGDNIEQVRTWDREKYWDRYPEELIVPAWPTVGRVEGIG